MSDSASNGADPPDRWVDAAEQLLAEEMASEDGIELTADGLAVDVPMAFGDDAPTASWTFDGSLRVRVEGHTGPLYEWVRLWRDDRD
ncbi:MAG: hypothetical protein ABEJ79_04960 [Halolamina sp.]